MRKFFPNQSSIGAFQCGRSTSRDRKWIQIVGVCADTRFNNLRDDPPPAHFQLYRQRPNVGGLTYIVRTPLRPEAIVPALRKAVKAIDPNLPLMEVRTQQQQIDDLTQQERILATLTSGFGLLALALACVGIYGIMAYTVAQSTNEIGIRLALGAQRGQVRGMVLTEAGSLAVLGMVAGLAVALGLGRLVKSMLYGLQPVDPLSLAGDSCLLTAVALINARSRAEPMEALRQE